MKTDFTQEELKNISALINASSIKGQDALTVALIQQKIAKLMTTEEPVVEPKT